MLALLLACAPTEGPKDTADTAPLDTADSGLSGADDSDDTTPVDTSNHETDSGHDSDSGETAETGDTSPPVDPSLYPLAPTAEQFAWQGLQEAFLRGDGAACTGSVTVGVGRTAVCYAAADGALRCAGSVYGLGQTASFVDVGLRDVKQVFVSGDDPASVCALVGGDLRCVGDRNDYGQFGAGIDGASAAWTTARRTDLAYLATGAWDQLCAVDTTGGAWCAGYGHGNTLVSVGSSDRVWVEADGSVRVGDTRTWRVSPSRSIAWLGSSGLDSDSIVSRYGGLDGLTGLVDVVVKQRFPDGSTSTYTEEVCLLGADGAVSCTRLDASGLPVTSAWFAGARVVLLAAAYDATTLCAVVDDGGLWCAGANEHGQLGRGDTVDLTSAAQVVAAGGVRIACE